jgi:hypothetical protein
MVMDVRDNIYLWNLLEDDTGPIFSKRIDE